MLSNFICKINLLFFCIRYCSYRTTSRVAEKENNLVDVSRVKEIPSAGEPKMIAKEATIAEGETILGKRGGW